MSDNNFGTFAVGEVHNPIRNLDRSIEYTNNEVSIRYPSRLGAMTLDASRIAQNNNLVFEAGQISFCVDVCKNITVSIRDDEEIAVSERSPRPSLATHAARLMQQALKITNGFDIDIQDEVDLRHTGLGSSGSTIAGVAAAINEIYGRPIDDLNLARYSTHNYGEEIKDDPDRLMIVQSIGGSAMCGLVEGGLIIISGKAVPIFSKNLGENTQVIIGVPEDYVPLDAQAMMEAEIANMDGFTHAGNEHAEEISYRLVHEVLPGLVTGSLKPCKDLIFDYRWDMGSIASCSFVYPRMIDIAESLRDLKNDSRVDIIAPSSVGPAFFALSQDPNYISERFNELGMKLYNTTVHNGRYQVLGVENARE